MSFPDSLGKSVEFPAPHFLAGTAFSACIWGEKQVDFLVDGYYARQTYLNRCHIMTATGVTALSIPVVRGGHRQLLATAEVDNREPWVARVCRTLQSAYGKAPYYAELADRLYPVLRGQHTLLVELNFALLLACRDFSGADRSAWRLRIGPFEGTPDHDHPAARLHPKKQLPPLFRQLPAYRHIFSGRPDLPGLAQQSGQGAPSGKPLFYPGLSIVDLLFCKGPDAGHYLQLQSACLAGA